MNKVLSKSVKSSIQIRFKVLSKSGTKFYPNQVQSSIQIRFKVLSKSGTKFYPKFDESVICRRFSSVVTWMSVKPVIRHLCLGSPGKNSRERSWLRHWFRQDIGSYNVQTLSCLNQWRNQDLFSCMSRPERSGWRRGRRWRSVTEPPTTGAMTSLCSRERTKCSRYAEVGARFKNERILLPRKWVSSSAPCFKSYLHFSAERLRLHLSSLFWIQLHFQPYIATLNCIITIVTLEICLSDSGDDDGGYEFVTVIMLIIMIAEMMTLVMLWFCAVNYSR